MIIDTSAWIEFFSGADSTPSRWFADRLAGEAALIVPEVVLMELLMGTADEKGAAARRRRDISTIIMRQ